MSRTVGFPNAKRFDELFTLTTKDDEGVWWSGEEFDVKKGKLVKARCRIGTFCAVSGKSRYHFHVKPTAEVIEHIKANTIFCGVRDSISFKAVIRDDGTALLIAEHSLIIGSVWLALVDASSLPADPDPVTEGDE
jgi:hypothetical protein